MKISFRKDLWKKMPQKEKKNEKTEKKNQRWNQAFTFVETLAVLAITAVLIVVFL